MGRGLRLTGTRRDGEGTGTDRDEKGVGGDWD